VLARWGRIRRHRRARRRAQSRRPATPLAQTILLSAPNCRQITQMKNGASRVRRLLAAGGISLTSHLRWKIIAPYLVLTIAVAMAGTFIATRPDHRDPRGPF